MKYYALVDIDDEVVQVNKINEKRVSLDTAPPRNHEWIEITEAEYRKFLEDSKTAMPRINKASKKMVQPRAWYNRELGVDAPDPRDPYDPLDETKRAARENRFGSPTTR